MTREEKLKLAIKKGYTYDKETGKIYGVRGKEITAISTDGYHYIKLRHKMIRYTIKAHQFAWYYEKNEIPKCLDHINRIKTDNRLENLRSVTHQENTFNREFKGYHWRNDRNYWVVTITVNNKSIYIGSYNNTNDAHMAYLEAKKKYHIYEN